MCVSVRCFEVVQSPIPHQLPCVAWGCGACVPTIWWQGAFDMPYLLCCLARCCYTCCLRVVAILGFLCVVLGALALAVLAHLVMFMNFVFKIWWRWNSIPEQRRLRPLVLLPGRSLLLEGSTANGEGAVAGNWDSNDTMAGAQSSPASVA